LLRTIVASRFEPVETISMGHAAESSMYCKYRLASVGSDRYVDAPVVEADHPLKRLYTGSQSVNV
jgi:hypothetical protein